MAYHACVVRAHRVAYVELSGRVDRSDLFDVLRALREEGWEASFKVLCNATSIHELVLKPGELRRFVNLVELPTDEQEHGRVAIVVQRPLDYSAAHLYKELAAQHGFRVEVCWSKKRAYAKLGLDGVSEGLEREFQQRDL